jgi:hypothetical protein
MIKERYFAVPAISNSAMGAINPEQGGSPSKYKAFFEDRGEERLSLSLERGKLVHLYCESPSEFIISDIEKPSEAISQITEKIYSQLMVDPHLDLDQAILQIAGIVGYGQSWKPDTIVKKVKEASAEYLKFLSKSKGKVIMSKATKGIIDNCIESLHKHQIANRLLFDKEYAGEENYNELEVYWSAEVSLTTSATDASVGLDFKAMLDRVIVRHDLKRIIIPDIKTTAKAKSLFQKAFEEYRYYRQQAFYQNAIYAYLKYKYPDIDFRDYNIDSYNIVIETTGKFEVAVIPTSPFWLYKGKAESGELIKRIARHTHENIWDYSMEEIQHGGYLKLRDKELYI